jgi:hypothetical protein
MWEWRLEAVAPTAASDLEAIPKMHLTADGGVIVAGSHSHKKIFRNY